MRGKKIERTDISKRDILKLYRLFQSVRQIVCVTNCYTISTSYRVKGCPLEDAQTLVFAL